MDNDNFPKGYNWKCEFCGTYASVAVADLRNYVCPECHGQKLQHFSKKAVEVPKVLTLPESPLKFKDDRFVTGTKKKRKSSSKRKLK